MSSERVQEIQKHITRIGDLPTLPEVATKVSMLVKDPNSNVSDIVSVIRNDPSLTSKILKIANSAFYGMRRRIESLNMALVILGMREINSLVTAISIFKAFPSDSVNSDFDYRQFWLHSAGVGEIAKLLGRRLGFREESSVFTGGLLHDLGKIVIAKYFFEEFVESLELSAKENISMREAENRILGTDHTEIGAWLAERWGLPDFLVNTIRFHHHVLQAPTNDAEIALVHLADIFCKSADIGFGGDRVKTAIVDDPAWTVLQSRKPNMASLDLERFTFDIETEIENAHEFLNTTLNSN